MKKIYLLLLAVICSVGMGWADNYLPGDWNWSNTDASHKFTFTDGVGSLTLSLAANTTYNFKLYSTENSNLYGNGGTMEYFNHTGWTFGVDNSSSGACKILTQAAGDYTFHVSWSGSTPTISVDYPALDWSIIGFVGNGAGGNYTDKYKTYLQSGVSVVNIQRPGFASADGFYITFPSADFGEVRADGEVLSYDVQGAGICLHLSNFTYKETLVQVMNSGNTAVRFSFIVFYVDGNSRTADTEAPVISSVTYNNLTYKSCKLTVAASDNEGVTSYIVKNGETTVGTYENNEFTLTGLSAETSYTFTVYAVDRAENQSAGVGVSFTTPAAPEGQELTSGDHSIFVTPIHYTNIPVNNYVLTITSDEEISGLGGSYWSTSNGNQAMNESSLGHSVDAHTYVVTTTSTTDPNIYTPLYVLMPGQVTFTDVVFNWIDKTIADEEKPVMTSAVVGTVRHNTATVTVAATDNVGVAKYVVKNGDNTLGEYTAVDNVITIKELNPETAYTLNVYAKDGADNVSENAIEITFTTTVAPEGQELTNGDNTVLVVPVHYTNLSTNNYVLTITSDKEIVGLGGSYWSTSNGNEQMNQASIGHSVDAHTYVITTTSTTDPSIYTPLYVLMPGQVAFDVVLDWLAKEASAEVKISAAGYATYACDHNFTLSGEVEAYKGALNNNELTATKLTGIIPAGEGLILKSTNGGEATATITYTTEAATADVADNDLVGTLVELNADAISAIEDEEGKTVTTLGLSEGVVGFRKPANNTISANKAYLLVDTPVANAAPVRITFRTDTATDVEAVEAEAAVKFIENGQLFIKKNGVVYNVMGQIVR